MLLISGTEFPSDMDEPKYQIGAGQLGTPTTVN